MFIKYYSIGEASIVCGVSTKTLRYYDKIGLLPPAYRNLKTGYRYYQLDQLIHLLFIKQLREIDVPLATIKRVMNSSDVIKEARTVMNSKVQQISEDIRTLAEIQAKADILLQRLKEIETDDISFGIKSNDGGSDIVLESIPDQVLLSIRRTIKNYKNEELNISLWGELLDLANRYHLVSTGPISVIYHCAPMEQFYTEICDYEIVLPIKASSIEDKYYDRIAPYLKECFGFNAATLIYKGNYQGLIFPYLQIMKWINRNNYQLNDYIRDVFLVSPIDTSSRDFCLTKILAPVKKVEK